VKWSPDATLQRCPCRDRQVAEVSDPAETGTSLVEGDAVYSDIVQDWSAAEIANPDRLEYYESERALGFLYRSLELPTHEALFGPKFGDGAAPFADNLSVRLLAQVQLFLPSCKSTNAEPGWLVELFQRYLHELRYICATHSLSSVAGSRLTEEEVVVGSILAESTQVGPTSGGNI
jgi:hypothetical protein